MSKRSRTNVLFLLCMCLTQLGHAQKNEPTSDLQGSLVGGNVYVNAALGMTITLPGTWELGRAVPTQSKPPSDCSGPLCGNPEINLILRTKGDSTPAARVRLAGDKLSGPYLNRSRHPLSEFADIMLGGSMRSGSDLAPTGGWYAGRDRAQNNRIRVRSERICVYARPFGTRFQSAGSPISN